MLVKSVSDVDAGYVGQREASQVRKFHEDRILNRVLNATC